LADACLSSGDPSEAAKWADEAIALEPFRESGYRRLMRAHAAAGNSAEALRAYDRCRRLLADELGAYPSAETESIYRELLSTAPADPHETAATVEPPAPEQDTIRLRRRPRRFVITTAALAAAAAGTALGLVLAEGGNSTSGTTVDANVVGLVDVKSGKIASQIAVGIAPTEVAGNEKAIWVTSADGSSVSRIDPQTNNVRQTIDIGGGP